MNVFILSGAGISAESGLSTFRDPDGLWERYDPYQLATPEAFARDPNLVRRWYDSRRRALLAVEPNAAHRALARLGAALRQRGGTLFLCTQNVDDLHERAGSTEVLHMHGELRKARCTACGAVRAWSKDMVGNTACPACGAGEGLRPHVVWFGEMPLGLDAIDEAMARADLFAAIGTSGVVQPAAGFVRMANRAGARTVELNLERSDVSDLFETRHIGRASATVPAWVDALLGETTAP